MSNANNDPLGDRGNAGPQPAAGQPYYQQPAYGSPQPSRGGRFFAWIRSSQVKRGHDRWIGGVCDGIARRLGWNTTLVRALVVVATLFFGAGAAFYGLAWFVLPDERDNQILAEDLINGKWDWNLHWRVAVLHCGHLFAGCGMACFRVGRVGAVASAQ